MRLIKEHQVKDTDFSVVSNPEFLREGAAIGDFMRPDRVVIGGSDPEAIAIMRDLYRPLFDRNAFRDYFGLRGAELISTRLMLFGYEFPYQRDCKSVRKVGCDDARCCPGARHGPSYWPKFLHAGQDSVVRCFPKDTAALR
jgi:UDPglucose 6-dehydrogenase